MNGESLEFATCRTEARVSQRTTWGAAAPQPYIAGAGLGLAIKIIAIVKGDKSRRHENLFQGIGSR